MIPEKPKNPLSIKNEISKIPPYFKEIGTFGDNSELLFFFVPGSGNDATSEKERY